MKEHMNLETKQEQKAETPKVDAVKAKKVNLTFQRDKDREMVKGIFRNFETRGGVLRFVFKGYPGDPVKTYTFHDGETVTIPLGVAKHLNRNCWTPSYSYLNTDTVKGFGARGRSMEVVGKQRRFGFQSLEFIDLEDMTMDGRPTNDVVGVNFK